MCKFEVGKTYSLSNGIMVVVLTTTRPETTLPLLCMEIKSGTLWAFDLAGKSNSYLYLLPPKEEIFVNKTITGDAFGYASHTAALAGAFRIEKNHEYIGKRFVEAD